MMGCVVIKTNIGALVSLSGLAGMETRGNVKKYESNGINMETTTTITITTTTTTTSEMEAALGGTDEKQHSPAPEVPPLDAKSSPSVFGVCQPSAEQR